VLLFGAEPQVQIICAAVERLAQIDAGIAEWITDYRKSQQMSTTSAPSAPRHYQRRRPE
jgi:hypothetical protein